MTRHRLTLPGDWTYDPGTDVWELLVDGAAMARISGAAPGLTVEELPDDLDGRRSWELQLAFTTPLNLNDRPSISVGAMHARRKEVKAWRQHAADLARSAGIPRLERFGAQLHYQPRDNRRRDTHNLARACKPLVDGLVDAGVCADDDSSRYRPLEPIIHPARRKEPGRLWLVVYDLGDEPGTQTALQV